MVNQVMAEKTKVLMPSDYYEPTQLLLGESVEGYQALAKQITIGFHPFDIFEPIWLGEFVDLTWDIFRLRDLKTKLSNLAFAKSIRAANTLVDQEVKKYERNQKTLASTKDGCQTDLSDPELDEFLYSVASTSDMRLVGAKVLEQHLDCIERIDGMIAIYQARRNNILREVDHHRLNFSPIKTELKAAQFELVQSQGQKHGKREKIKG